jgi:hypothetical protein
VATFKGLRTGDVVAYRVYVGQALQNGVLAPRFRRERGAVLPFMALADRVIVGPGVTVDESNYLATIRRVGE